MRRNRIRCITGALTTLTLATALTGTSSPMAVAGPKPPGPQVVARGLDNPRGLTWGSGGSLLVAEAGRGGSGTCVPGLFSARMCLGDTGGVTRISRNGKQRRIVSGLPSLADPVTGGFAIGPSDVFRDHGREYVSVGGPTSYLDRKVFAEPSAAAFGTIRQISDHRSRSIADLAAFELAHDPDGLAHESNPQSVLAQQRTVYAVDAAGNTLFRIDRSGRTELLATFANRTFAGREYQPVPSALATGPDGAVYVADLTGAPFPDGESRVWRWTPAGLETFATGFTSAVDLAFGPDGSLYVLELNPGRVVRVRPDGTRTIVVDSAAGLASPTGITVGPDSSVYVTNCGVCAGAGTVLRFAPSAP